jgi:hypothetical protein
MSWGCFQKKLSLAQFQLLLSGKTFDVTFTLLSLGFGRTFFGMDKLYRPAVFGITTAITFIMVVYSTRKVISYTCIEGFIAAFDSVDMPGHKVGILQDICFQKLRLFGHTEGSSLR